MEEFKNNEDLTDEIIEKKENKQCMRKKEFLLIAIVFAVVIIISVILIAYKSSHEDNDKYGEISCLYKIDNSTNEIRILSEDFNYSNIPKISIYINDTKIKNFGKFYKFETEGFYQIKILN